MKTDSPTSVFLLKFLWFSVVSLLCLSQFLSLELTSYKLDWLMLTLEEGTHWSPPVLLLLPLSPQPLIPENYDICNSNNSSNKEEDEYNFRKKGGLFCIIAGIEHTGTTMASSLEMNAPDLYGAFELGLLLSETPGGFRSVEPPVFYAGITAPVTNYWWGLNNSHREELLEAKCHAEHYNLLRKYSPIYKVHNSSWIVDKTPRYYQKLYSIMQRTPNVPVIVTQKDDESVIR
jgi:hypothetical protein